MYLYQQYEISVYLTQLTDEGSIPNVPGVPQDLRSRSFARARDGLAAGLELAVAIR